MIGRTMSQRKYDALFIDFYGTISAGDRQAVEDTCALIVDRLGLEMPATELSVAWGRTFFQAIDDTDGDFRNLFELELDTLVETVEPMYGSFDPVPFVQHLKQYWADPGLQPEAIEALSRLKVPICCVSNADTEDIAAAVEKHRIPLDCIITSEDARSYKPDSAIFERALARMDVRPERVLHVGDSLHSDVGGAQPLGIATAWICREGRIFDVGEATPDHKISSLLELGEILS